MPETGLVVAGPEPIESVYKLDPNGLYLPPISKKFLAPKEWLSSTPYPEFAMELVDQYNKGFVKPPIVKFYSSPRRRKTLWELVPDLTITRPTKCPDRYCPYVGNNIMTVGIHLNDDHERSREWIADWLDTIPNVDLTVKVA